jgi:long-chain acyl-CoA synthetase
VKAASTARKAAPAPATAPGVLEDVAVLDEARDLQPLDTDQQPADGRMPDPAQVQRSWLASYPPGVPETYEYPVVPLTRFLDDAARDFPQTTAVEFLGAKTSYRELLDQVDSFAGALRSLGVRKGDRVGVILPNCPQHVVAIFAILRLGAIVAENNPLYTEVELEHQLADAGCRAVIFLDSLYPKVKPLRSRLKGVEHWIGTGIQEALPFAKKRLFPMKGRKDGTYLKIPDADRVKRMTDLIRKNKPATEQAPVDALDDVAMLVYTGGTTGVSKGVMLTHHNLVANAFQGRLWLPDVQAGRETILCVMPFFHSYGLTTCLTIGVLSAATLSLLPRFERDMVLKAIEQQKPTLFPGVPTMYVALNNAPDVKKYKLSSIRACLSGAAPLPVEVAKTFEELTGGKLREGYGLTETSPITHANPIYGKAKKGSIGLPVPDTIAALVDVDDPTVLVEPGGIGELVIAGPQVMKGYWNRPDETELVLRDGWLLTGDIAQIDDEGYFAIVDRKKDMVIAGGYNIYPRDIEEVLYAHPKVEKAVVAGIPDEYRGETVKAYIVLKQGQTATPEEMDDFCRDRLAPYKVPKAYEFRDSLPETLVGKVLRRKLIEEELAKSGSTP